jgi:putative endonuclease
MTSGEPYFVYMLASRIGGTIYIGVTHRLRQRVWEHKNDVVDGFTRRYGVHQLVWFEAFDDVTAAIQREKQMKEWRRAWKIRLIQEHNPNWDDLFPGLGY